MQNLIKEINKEDNKIGLFLEKPQKNKGHLDPIKPPPKRQFSSKIGVSKLIGENKGNYNTDNSSIKNNDLNLKKILLEKHHMKDVILLF